MPTTRPPFFRSPRAARAAAAAACCAAACAVLWACGRPSAAGPFLLVVSGDTHGWITPCGCTVNQSGGLLRRGTYVADLRARQPVLYADAGGAADGTSDYHALKMAAIARGEVLMQIAAHNLGGSEIALGRARLDELARTTGVPWVSANVTAADGRPIAPAVRAATVAGRRVALVGVASPRYQTAELRVAPPREAVLNAVGGRKDAFDLLIVLAYMPDDELEALARELPEADAIVGGPTGQSVPPRRVGPTWLASATNKGKFAAEIPFPGDKVRIVELTGQFADAADQSRNLRQYLADLLAADFPAAATGLAPDAPRQPRAAGGASCVDCHAADRTVWEGTGHAHAWASLQKTGAHADPSCQVCHTTSYAAPGGFSSIAGTPRLVDVGCESCHGPAADHARNPAVRTPFLAKAQCAVCHDGENSPGFTFDAYWPRIRHGAKETTP
jgi:hypothetical protein